jgi:hypothetical protein
MCIDRGIVEAVLLSLLSLLLIATAAVRSDADSMPDSTSLPSREFNSELPLDVCLGQQADVCPFQEAQFLGRTPSDKPLSIPTGRLWYVRPKFKVDGQLLAQEVKSKIIPGLDLGNLQWSTSDPSLPQEIAGVRLQDPGYDVSDAGLADFKDLNTLRALSLAGTNITDAGLKYVNGLTALQALDLTATQITDKGLESLKDLKSLRDLDLEQTKIEGAGFKYFTALKALRTLNLFMAPVADPELAHLKGLTALEHLDLSGTKVTDAGLGYVKGLSS